MGLYKATDILLTTIDDILLNGCNDGCTTNDGAVTFNKECIHHGEAVMIYSEYIKNKYGSMAREA